MRNVWLVVRKSNPNLVLMLLALFRSHNWQIKVAEPRDSWDLLREKGRAYPRDGEIDVRGNDRKWRLNLFLISYPHVENNRRKARIAGLYSEYGQAHYWQLADSYRRHPYQGWAWGRGGLESRWFVLPRHDAVGNRPFHDRLKLESRLYWPHNSRKP